MAFRADVLAGMGCSFDVVITADYGDAVHNFEVHCQSDENGGLRFTVTKPESISGIHGVISAQGGKLTFGEDKALAFEMMAGGQITPVSAPWLLLKTLRGGYVKSCGMDGELLRVTIDDGYEEDTLTVDVWFDELTQPMYAEIMWADRRIVSMEVKNFAIL